MSERRLAAGALLGSFRGTRAPARVLELVEEGLGGVVLFADNVTDDDQLGTLCATLRSARVDVVIAIDEEAGDVTRLDARHGSPLPGHAALGVVDDVATTNEIAGRLGRRLADVGITLDLAPCADVNVNPENPIIGVRSFSSDVAVASRHVAAFVEGMQQVGVAACVKHFPGHGGSSVDSHTSAPVLTETLDELLAGPLRPFAAAIGSGVECVMTGHLVVPEVDGRPASMSRRWTQLLRESLHFDGVIVTDALDMGAVAGAHGATASLPAVAVASLGAGADLLCLGSDLGDESIGATVDAIAAALVDGRLDGALLARSRERIERMKRRTAGWRPSPGATHEESVADRGREIAMAALRVEGDLTASPTGRVIECRPEPSVAVGTTPWGLVDLLDGTGWTGRRVHRGQRPDVDLVGPSDAPLVVVVRGAANDPWQRCVIDHCLERHPDLVVVEMGWPGPRPPAVRARLCTFGASRAGSEAALRCLVDGPRLGDPGRRS